MKKIVWLSVVLTVLGMNLSFADEAEQKQCETNGINYKNAQSFVHNLQQAFKKNDKQKISQLIAYPLRVNTHENKTQKVNHYTIKTQREFISQYQVIFTPARVKEILNEKGIFCNYQGAMLAGGLIWFDGSKIFAINI